VVDKNVIWKEINWSKLINNRRENRDMSIGRSSTESDNEGWFIMVTTIKKKRKQFVAKTTRTNTTSNKNEVGALLSCFFWSIIWQAKLIIINRRTRTK
jgi:hypothetical protein